MAICHVHFTWGKNMSIKLIYVFCGANAGQLIECSDVEAPAVLRKYAPNAVDVTGTNWDALPQASSDCGDVDTSKIPNFAPPVTSFAVEVPGNHILLTTAQAVITNVQPQNGDVSKVTWSSDHPEYMTVDANGLVTFVGTGRSYISAVINGHSQRVSVTSVGAALNPSSDAANYPLQAESDNVIAFNSTQDQSNAIIGFQDNIAKDNHKTSHTFERNRYTVVGFYYDKASDKIVMLIINRRSIAGGNPPKNYGEDFPDWKVNTNFTLANADVDRGVHPAIGGGFYGNVEAIELKWDATTGDAKKLKDFLIANPTSGISIGHVGALPNGDRMTETPTP